MWGEAEPWGWNSGHRSWRQAYLPREPPPFSGILSKMKKHICENDYDSSESTGQCLPQSLVSIWASVEMEAMGWRGPNQNRVSRFNSDMIVLGQCRLRARLVRVLCFDNVVL